MGSPGYTVPSSFHENLHLHQQTHPDKCKPGQGQQQSCEIVQRVSRDAGHGQTDQRRVVQERRGRGEKSGFSFMSYSPHYSHLPQKKEIFKSIFQGKRKKEITWSP